MLTGGGNHAKPTNLNAGSTSELEVVKTSENKLFIPEFRVEEDEEEQAAMSDMSIDIDYLE